MPSDPCAPVSLFMAVQSSFLPFALSILRSSLVLYLSIRRPIFSVSASASPSRSRRLNEFRRRSRYFISGVMKHALHVLDAPAYAHYVHVGLQDMKFAAIRDSDLD